MYVVAGVEESSSRPRRRRALTRRHDRLSPASRERSAALGPRLRRSTLHWITHQEDSGRPPATHNYIVCRGDCVLPADNDYTSDTVERCWRQPVFWLYMRSCIYVCVYIQNTKKFV